jgi:hypothetical protein
MTHHVVNLSGGGGSWLTAKIVYREFVRPGDQFTMAFADTLYEDADCYRFLLQGACDVMGVSSAWVPLADTFPDYRAPADTPIETYAGNPEWRSFLHELRAWMPFAVDNLVWLVEGRDPWEIYRDERFLGNSQRDPCSKFAKRQVLDKWRDANFDPTDTIIYFGIGSAESHRYDDKKGGGIKGRLAAAGWHAEAPLIGRQEGDLSSSIYMAKAGLVRPRLYQWYAHNNCGGMCCKAGQKHWKARLEFQPERYEYDRLMEKKISDFLAGPARSFLTDRRGDNIKKTLTLGDFRNRLQAGGYVMPEPQPGDDGCGCMVDP